MTCLKVKGMATDIATAIAIAVAMVRASRITKIREQKQCMHVGRVDSSWRKSKSKSKRKSSINRPRKFSV